MRLPRTHETRVLRILPALLCLLAWRVSAYPQGPEAGAGTVPRTLARDPDYVIVPGRLLPDLLGREVAAMRLYALRQGEWVPVPFQIDERRPDGVLVCPLGKHPEADRDGGLLDDNDELVFMADDTGDRAADGDRPAGSGPCVQIRLRDPVDGGEGWCTLSAERAPARPAETDYIEYQPDRDAYVALYNTGVYMRDGVNRADYNVNIFPPAAGGTGVDITDRLKIRLTLRLRAPPVTLHFDEDQMEVDTRAYIDGPVRIVRRNQLYLRVPMLSIPFGGAHDVIVYRDTNDTPIQISLPRGTSWLVKQLVLCLGTDLSPEALGMTWASACNPEGVLVDGRMSPQEERLDLRLPPEGRPEYWQVLSGPQGSLMRRGSYDPETRDTFRTHIEYADDLSEPDPPEAFPGRIGHASLCITIDDVEPGSRVFVQQWYYPHHAYPVDARDVQRYMNILNRPLIVETDG